MDDVSAVILAGGKSQRMGFNKALFELGKASMVERIAGELSRHFREVVLVASDPEIYADLGLRVITDIYQGRGPLGGIHAALVKTSAKHIFVTACDMPFVDAGLARYLSGQAHNFDVVAPRLGQYIEPLYAVYGRGCIPAIEAQLIRGRCKISAFYASVRVCYVGEDEIARLVDPGRVFFNVNTPADLEQVSKLLK